MSGSVTKCLDCGTFVHAGIIKCPGCGSTNIVPTLRQVHSTLYATDPDFRKQIDEQREKDRHCPKCGSPIDREGFMERHGYSKSRKYDCPNCGANLITVEVTDYGTHSTEHKT